MIRYANPQSTNIPRVPQCLSPRANWDPPPPSPARKCARPPEPKGGRRIRLRVRGWGLSQFGTTGEKAYNSVYSVSKP